MHVCEKEQPLSAHPMTGTRQQHMVWLSQEGRRLQGTEGGIPHLLIGTLQIPVNLICARRQILDLMCLQWGSVLGLLHFVLLHKLLYM